MSGGLETNKEVNPNAVATVAGKIRTALATGRAQGHLIALWEEPFKPVIEEVHKHCGTWLSDGDILDFLYKELRGELPSPKADSGEVYALSSVLPPGRMESIAQRVAGRFAALPLRYVIRFPLPNCNFDQDFSLSDRVSLVPNRESATGAGLLGPAPGSGPGTTCLQILCRGYAGRDLHQSATRDAVGTLKRVIQVCVLKRLLRVREPHEMGIINSIVFQSSHTFLQVQILSEDLQDTIASVPLDPDTSLYLSKLIVRYPPDIADKIKWFKSAAAMIVDLVSANPPPPNTEALRSALEWSFDADADQNPNVSFIKTCISLEAVLSEDSSPDRVTERLADRCAFVLSRVPSKRSEIREAMRKVYTLRSSLVHGAKRKFDPQENNTRSLGEAFLRGVLSKEIEAIERWHLAFRERQAESIGGPD